MTGEELDDAVVIALGSNLAGAWESSEAVIKQALDEFPKIEVRVKAKSTLWRSMAWPDPGGPPYLNAVALVETALPAPALLAALHGLEDRFGRRRERPNAPRTLDLDLIAYGRAVIQGPPLWIPHPRARERGFVMGPLAQIAPAWKHPVDGAVAADLARAVQVGRDASPLTPDVLDVAKSAASPYVSTS